jgi:hypothetical protein
LHNVACALNNPLRFIDPTGNNPTGSCDYDINLTQEECGDVDGNWIEGGDDGRELFEFELYTDQSVNFGDGLRKQLHADHLPGVHYHLLSER